VTEGGWFAGGSGILITGAASGLGRSLALEAHRRGRKTWLVDISPAVADVARTTGGESLVADLSDPSSYARIVSWAPDIDILINNAGIAIKAPFTGIAPASIDKLIAINVSAPVQLSRLYLERFQRRGRGVIVNVSSSASYFPTPGLGAYGASKAFLSAFSESLAVEMGSQGVQVLAVSPSGMKTNFQQSAGVRNEKESLLLDPDAVARQMWDDIDAGKEGITDYGVTSFVFRTMRAVLPRGMYRAVIGRLMGKYR
jgi:short-subunit dehydrogenase